MSEKYSVKAILTAADKGFSSTMKSAMGYATNLKTTLTSGLGFGVMMAAGQKAFSVVTGSMSGFAKETISTSDSMQKLQQAMRFSGEAEEEIQRIAGATGTLKTYADKTVFSLEDVMSTFGALSANGIKDADKMTEAVGNAVAVFGGGAQEFSSVGLAFSQAMASGALHAQDWNQILNASPQLAGGLKKELVKLNPVLGEDFKQAMEDGAITAELLGEAMNNIGMTDLAKEAATSVKTFEGAMGNMQATVTSGMMSLYETYAKDKVVGAINSFNDKVGAGFSKLESVIPKAIEKVSPYWNVLKENAIEVKDAFGEAFSAIGGELKELSKSFGSTESIKSFSNVVKDVADGLKTFAGFLKENDKTVAKVIANFPKMVLAFKGMKIAKAVAPGVFTFSRALLGLTGKGISLIADKLFGISKRQKGLGKSSAESSGQIVESAKSFMLLGAAVFLISAGFGILALSAVSLANAGGLAIGVMVGLGVALAGMMIGMTMILKTLAPMSAQLMPVAIAMLALGAAVLLVSAGFAVLAFTSIQLANAGGLAIGVMVGMIAAVALLAVGAAALGPALTAGAVGFVAFGIALVLVGTGALLASAALALVATVLPQVASYGLAGAIAIMQLGVGMTVFAAGAAVTGAACVILGAGLALVGAALLAVSASVLIIGAGMMLIGTGALSAAIGLEKLASSLPKLAAGAFENAAALTVLAGGLTIFGSAAMVAGVGVTVLGAALIVASVGLNLLGTGSMLAYAGLSLLSTLFPVISEYGLRASDSLLALGASLAAFGAGALVVSAAVVVLGAGLLVASTAVLVLCAGVLVLSGAMMAISVSAIAAVAALSIFVLLLPALTSNGSAGASIVLALGSALLVFSVGALAAGASCLPLTAGLLMFGAAMTTGAAGTLLMATALKSVNSSMKSISKNAKSAENSLDSMRGSVDVVGSGLDAIGNKAKSAMKALISAFDNAAGKASASGKKVGSGFNQGLRVGMTSAVATSSAMTGTIVATLRAAQSGAYSSGVYIGQGLANGIRATLGTVRSVATQLAAAAEAAIRAKARIHSPSKVTDSLGRYYGEGWIGGLKRKLKESAKVARELVVIPELNKPELSLAGIGANGALKEEYEYRRNASYTIVVPVEIDGRETARVIAPYTQEELERMETRDNRRHGRR